MNDYATARERTQDEPTVPGWLYALGWAAALLQFGLWLWCAA